MPSATSLRSLLGRAAFWLTGGAAVAIVFSIAACQILLALALVALLFSGTRLRFPPIGLPLGLFMLGTVLSLAFSADSVSGRPQLRKFFVFLMILVVSSAFREVAQLRRLMLCWAGAGALAAARGLVQFGEKYREAVFSGQSFYEYYVGERITGFMSHWMTFSGQLMIVLLMLCAFLFFSPAARGKLRWYGLLSAALLAPAIVLGFTRSIWLAGGVSGLYLVAFWRRRLLWAVPALVAAGIWFAPPSVRSRVTSMFQPQKEIDSNQHRIICWRTGWEMIKAHPWLGLGPEQVRVQFEKYLPSDIPKPLPSGWYGHLHSIYVHYAAERGVPTMLMLVWLLVKILYDFLAAVRRLPPGPSDARFILHGAISVVLAIMVSGIFELNLGDSEVLTMFLVVIAAGYVAR
ncbi:MAG TPA: O-antigen ligase family protein, partial [Bryobacteraceae bacterium]|nr:O-antigen ligase family protein [Bryobacteraceae bacterium]